MTTKAETKTVTKNETKPTKAPAKPKITPEMQALLDIRKLLRTGVNSAVRAANFEKVLNDNGIKLED